MTIAPADLGPDALTFAFTDAEGRAYRVTFGRNSFGRSTWRVQGEDGHGMEWSAFDEGEPDPSAAEISKRARGWVGSYIAQSQPHLVRPTDRTDAQGRALFHIGVFEVA